MSDQLMDVVVIVLTIGVVAWLVNKAGKGSKGSRRDEMRRKQQQNELWPSRLGAAKNRGKEFDKLERKERKK